MLYAGPKLENGAAADAFAVGAASYQPKPPWVKRLSSRWRNATSASGAATAASLRLIPFTAQQELEITGVDYWVQGSVTAGSQIFFGIYEADETTGLPTTKLWESGAISLTAGGGFTAAVTGLTSPPKRVWIATYISSGSTTQFVTGAISGDAEREFGVPVSMSVNAQIVALLATNTWAGSMPTALTFGSAAFTTGGNVPNTFLRLAAPV